MEIIMSIIGWSGVVFCTLGYLLLSMRKIRANSFAFQALNIVGGLCLALTALDTNDLPNAAANLLWMSIGLYALSRQFSKRQKKQP